MFDDGVENFLLAILHMTLFSKLSMLLLNDNKRRWGSLVFDKTKVGGVGFDTCKHIYD